MIFWEIKQDLSNLFDAIINRFLHIGFPSLLSSSLPPASIYGLLVGCHNSKQWSSWTTNSILGKKLNYRPNFLQKSLFLLTSVRSRATCESFHPVAKAVFIKSVLEPDSVIVTCQPFFSLDKIYSHSCCIVVEKPKGTEFPGRKMRHGGSLRQGGIPLVHMQSPQKDLTGVGFSKFCHTQMSLVNQLSPIGRSIRNTETRS